jgi:predicted ABC-type transport system involved in lysophospholipase L1 biosynthesis ATPase subunit
VNNPRLLLADEPTGNLDRSTATGIAELLLELQGYEKTMLIVVTHSLELAGMLERRVELNAGHLATTAV